MSELGGPAVRVLGVDGGQSAIRLSHSAMDGDVVVEGVSRLEGDTVAQVADAVARGVRDTAFPPTDLAVLGLTTAPSESGEADRLCRLVAEATGAHEVWLADDAVTAHAGALSGGWGVSLTVGTGVACLVAPMAGGARILGGHGYLLGDEGGGFWIGRRGLAAALRASEGRGAATTLVSAALRRYGGALADLHVRLHDADRPVHNIADFAPDVLDEAEAGDAAAKDILRAAAGELGALVDAAAQLAVGAGPAPATRVPLALGGRLMTPGTTLRTHLERWLLQAGSPVMPRTADGTPLAGCLRLGLAGRPHRYDALVHAWTPTPTRGASV